MRTVEPASRSVYEQLGFAEAVGAGTRTLCAAHPTSSMNVPAQAKYARQLLFVICLFVACSRGVAQKNVPAPAPPGRLVDVDGRRIHIYCTGQGSPAVVVASGGFSVDWGLVHPHVAARTQICTYDPAGVAWSDPLPGNRAPNCSERVNELHTLLKNAGIASPYIVVGYSIGGLVARLYAAMFPEQTAGLVLVDHAFIDTPPAGSFDP